MKKNKEKKKIMSKEKVNNIFKTIGEMLVGVSNLAFLASKGIAGYVFWFSTDSLTLKIVAGILIVNTAIDALKLSHKNL